MADESTAGESGADKKRQFLRRPTDFIRQIVEEDLRTNRYHGRVHTRFPPEPNGYIHLGSAKAICINFGIAEDYAGLYNLRFDDTNPTKEDVEYVESIKEDIRWLGFDWEDREFYASGLLRSNSMSMPCS